MTLHRSLQILAIAVCLAEVSPAAAQRAIAHSALGSRAIVVTPSAAGRDVVAAIRPRPGTVPADAPPHGVGSVWKHAGVGLVLGAGVGAALGIALDAGSENTFPVTLATTPVGALSGAMVGGLVWLHRRSALDR